MLRLHFIIGLLLTLGCTLPSFGQKAVIKGTITDAQSGEPLYGVNITTKDRKGTTTDINGRYEIKLPGGKYELKYSYLGYPSITKTAKVSEGQVKQLNIKMDQSSQELDVVVVSSSKYEKKLSEETVSMDVISPEMMENNNDRDLSESVTKVPGVNVIDGQAVIRGGAGYSFGAGTRVQVLVDGVPQIGGNLSDVKWDYIPMENAKQVEVIKGASSVLYGSSALNGIINVQTGYAKDEPETKLTVFQGMYDRPQEKEKVWWSEFYAPFYSGASISHRQRFGNLDLVIGGDINLEDSYLQGADDQRVRFNFKTRYRDPDIDGLSYGIDGRIMYHQFGQFILWQNADSGAYRPLGGYQTESSHISDNDRFLISSIKPHISYTTSNGTKHDFWTRFFTVNRFTELLFRDPNAQSHLIDGNYQFQKPFKDNLVLTTGLSASHSWNTSNVFDGELHTNGNAATYLQLEKKIDRLNLMAGGRVEMYYLDKYIENVRPVFRAGMNYHIGKSTYLRSSFGQGFRHPSLGERFIRQDLSSIEFFPNPSLDAEKGWNAEIGVKQSVKVGNWRGYVDFATFLTEYEDMINLRFDLFVPDSAENVQITDFEKYLGFKSLNTGNTRIAGYEVSAFGQGNIGPVDINLLAGYTYTYPAKLSSDPELGNFGNFFSNFFKAMHTTDNDILQGLAKYRFRHTARGNVEAGLGRFSVGLSMEYNSFMDKIDSIFVGEGKWGEIVTAARGEPVPGIKKFRKENDEGNVIFDTRVGVKIGKESQSKLTFIIKNITNNTYAIRPGKLQPPRNFTLQFQHNF